MSRTLLAGLPAFVLLLSPLQAQMQDNQEKTLACNEHYRGHQRLALWCEIKEQTLPAPSGVMNIDPGTNGGISVKGWSRPDVLVRVRIDTSAPSEVEARAMVQQIRFSSGSGQLKAEGPASDHDHNWGLSYEVFVPHQTDISGTAHNGGIRIQDVKGQISFHTTNGGVHLSRVGGDVSGNTTNGGVKVDLAGDRWDGKGLNVETTNGGVRVAMPANYSAHLETSTVNGGLHTDFAANTPGKPVKDMSFNIGAGGATIRATTTNGGVHISKI